MEDKTVDKKAIEEKSTTMDDRYNETSPYEPGCEIRCDNKFPMAEKLDSIYTEKEHRIIKELSEVINRNSMENGSNTPDFMIAEYLFSCYKSMNMVINNRNNWCKH